MFCHASPHALRGPPCLVPHTAQLHSLGSYFMLSTTSSPRRSSTSVSLHKSIIYSSCFPKIGTRKAPEQTQMQTVSCTSLHVFLAHLGFHHHHADQGMGRKELLLSNFPLLDTQSRAVKISVYARATLHTKKHPRHFLVLKSQRLLHSDTVMMDASALVLRARSSYSQ